MARCMAGGKTACETGCMAWAWARRVYGVGLTWVWRVYGATWRVYGVGMACMVACVWRVHGGVGAAWARRVPAGARICSLPESTSQQLQPGAPSRHSVAYLVRDGDGDRDRDRDRDRDGDRARVNGQKKG